MRDAFVKQLTALAAADPRIFLITGDLGFGVLTEFADRFPNQFLNAGVAEQNMTGLATGLALEGRVVFTYSIANFATLRCLEQIRNDAAYHDANVKVVAVGGGFSYGALGMSHHATEDLAILRSLPITVVAPGCDWETTEATKAITEVQGTCYLRLDKSTAGRTERPGEPYRLGTARVIRDGDAMSIIATGGILGAALEAADTLATDGIRCRVVSMHTVKPLDRHAVMDACRSTGGIVTVEEHALDGGLGGAVAECCLDAGVAPRLFHRIALRAGFSSIVGSQEYLRCRYGLDAASIRGAVTRLLRPASHKSATADTRVRPSLASADS
jgi:transketolase